MIIELGGDEANMEFKQEAFEEHYEAGDQIGRWVVAEPGDVGSALYSLNLWKRIPVLLRPPVP